MISRNYCENSLRSIKKLRESGELIMPAPGSMPKHAQEIFNKAYKAAIIQYNGDEEIAHKVAYAAVKKAGYRKVGDKWVASARQIDKDKIIVESGSISQILESENQDDGFIVEGVALIGDQVSGNGIYYPLKVVQDAVARAQGSLPLNMQHQHPDLDDAGNSSVLNTVGRLDALFMEGKVAKFKANIAPTQKGKDVRALIKGKYIGDISIRGYGDWVGSSRQNAKRDITKLTLLGIDFVSEGSVEGTGVTNIIRCAFSPELEDGGDLTTTVLEYIQESLEEIVKNEKVKEELALRISERDTTIEELRSQLNETKAEKAVLESKLRSIEKTKEIAELKESLISQQEGVSEDYKDVLRGVITGETEGEIKEAIEINLKAYAYLLSQQRNNNSVTGVPPQRNSVAVSQKGIEEEKEQSTPRPYIDWKNV